MAPGLVQVNAPADDAMSSALVAWANVHNGPPEAVLELELRRLRALLPLSLPLLNNDFKNPAVNASPAPVVSTYIQVDRYISSIIEHRMSE